MSYYELLEVEKTASLDEIKKAYRKKVVLCHPDKGGDVETFKKIQTAYEVLSDKEKRRQYDNPETKLPFDPFNFAFSGFENVFKTMNRQQQQTLLSVNVSLEELCQRKIKSVSFSRTKCCDCISQSKSQCQACNGSGIKTERINMMGIQMQNQTNCPNCIDGLKYTFCSKCKNGLILETKTIQLHLTPEHISGMPFIFGREGNQTLNQERQDLICQLNLLPHSVFKIKGNNLLCDITISLKEALTGFNRKLNHPNGEIIDIDVQEVINYNTKIKIENKGVLESGNLVVGFSIEFPVSITENVKNTLKAIL